MKVSIVGFSPSRIHAPRHGWEVWGMAWDAECLQMDRVFEMHDKSLIDPLLIERMQMCPRLYVQAPVSDLPAATVYPFDAVAKTTGAYWCSSVAYMLALAIHEGAEEIALFGVDGAEQYSYQHPNINFLLGLAMGRGIKVRLPDDCPLLAFVSDPDYDYAGRYGRLHGRDH